MISCHQFLQWDGQKDHVTTKRSTTRLTEQEIVNVQKPGFLAKLHKRGCLTLVCMQVCPKSDWIMSPRQPRHGQTARTTRPRLAARIHALAANKSNYKRAPRNTDHFSTSVKWRQDDLTRVRRQDAIRTPLPRRRIKLFDCQWHALFTAAAPNDQIIAATGL